MNIHVRFKGRLRGVHTDYAVLCTDVQLPTYATTTTLADEVATAVRNAGYEYIGEIEYGIFPLPPIK